MKTRQGGATLWAILFLGVLLAVLAIVVDLGMIWTAQAELRAVADATVLAAAHSWAAHLVPGGYDAEPEEVLNLVRGEAARYLTANAGGVPLLLLDNPDNASDGDVVFGFYDAPTGFAPARPSDLASPWLNAIKITVTRDKQHGNAPGWLFARLFGWSSAQVQASAVAVLERQIIGFQCTDGQAIPLVPIAILSDPTGQSNDTWESQVTAALVNGSEAQSLREVHVRLPVAAGTTAPSSSLDAAANALEEVARSGNACVVQIGTETWSETIRQTATGILPGDLIGGDFAGRLVLDPETGICSITAWPTVPSLNQREFAELFSVLVGLKERQEVRIWPLFAGFLPGATGSGASTWTAAVNGFVAARILHVELKSNPGTLATGNYVELTLEPRVLVTRTAIPATSLRTARPAEDRVWNPYQTQPNPYLVRIQLAE